MNLNYKPIVYSKNIESGTAEWLEERRKYIGASDAGPIMGQGSFGITNLKIYDDKINGPEPAKGEDIFSPDYDSGKFYMDKGTRLEPQILEILQHRLRYEFTKFLGKPYLLNLNKEEITYQHPLHEFMACHLDVMPFLDPTNLDEEGNPKMSFGELKTTNPENFKMNFREGVVGQNGKILASYEWQVRHMMAVMNIDRCYMLVSNTLSGKKEDNKLIVVNRDLELEEKLIAEEENFWNHVITRTPPKINCEINDTIVNNCFERAVKTEQVIKGEPDEIEVSLDTLDETKRYIFLDNQKKLIDSEMKALKANLASLIESHPSGIIFKDDQGKGYTIYSNVANKGSFIPDILEKNFNTIYNEFSYQKIVVDEDGLQAKYPEIYSECCDYKPVRTNFIKEVKKRGK